MIKHWRDKKLTLDIKLLYSVKNVTEAAFGDELKDFIIVESEKEGRLDEGKIKNIVRIGRIEVGGCADRRHWLQYLWN